MATRRVADSAPSTRAGAAAKKSAKPAPVAAAPKARKRRAVGAARATVTADQRRGMIAYSAYLRGERRGFAPGGETLDWLLAEQEVDALLSTGHTPTQ